MYNFFILNHKTKEKIMVHNSKGMLLALDKPDAINYCYDHRMTIPVNHTIHRVPVS